MNVFKKYLLKLKFNTWGKIKANFYPEANLSYSQFGEDMIIRYLAANIKQGFYVDIGAYHPIYFSNTYHFYCKGWKGINIDATPNSMELFSILRPRDINLEVCLSSKKDMEVDFYIFDQAAYNTFDINLANKALSLGVKLVDKQTIKTKTLKEILDNYLPLGTKPDLITIDVEGVDEEILMSNNWEVYHPEILIFEKHNFNIDEIADLNIIKYLNKYGYKVIGICSASIILKLEG